MVEAEAAGMVEGALEDLVVLASAAVILAACAPAISARCAWVAFVLVTSAECV
jgi:hypothetical protein